MQSIRYSVRNEETVRQLYDQDSTWRRKKGGGDRGETTDFPPKSIRYSIQSTPRLFSLSFSTYILCSVSFSTVVASFASRYSPTPSTFRTPFLHDYLAGCSARMQRYTRATRCIDDDNVAYRLVRPRARSLRTRRNNFALVYDTVFRRWRRSDRHVKFSKVRLPASHRCTVSVPI